MTYVFEWLEFHLADRFFFGTDLQNGSAALSKTADVHELAILLYEWIFQVV